MTWDELKALKCWIPLCAVPTTCGVLGDVLFGLGDHMYLVAVGHNRNLEFVAGTSFVTQVVWAVSDGAAQRAVNGRIEMDDRLVMAAPTQMLLAGTATTYGDIMRLFGTRRYGQVSESAHYRWSDGEFIHRIISGNSFCFYFRKREDDGSETPYAIAYRLPD